MKCHSLALLLVFVAAQGCAPPVLEQAPDPSPGDEAPAPDPQAGEPDSRTPWALQSEVGIILLDTRGVVVDEDEGGRLWVDVDLSFISGRGGAPARVDGPAQWEGSGAIHVRGNSSSSYDKKQYALETRDEAGQDIDVAPFGMPEEEDWVLAGPYSDKTLMRNHLMFGWSRAIGRYAPRTYFVELYMEDGQRGDDPYRGVYVLTEKIKRDKNRVAMEKLSPEDQMSPEVEGGYLLRRDWLEGHEVITRLYGDEIALETPKPDLVTDAQRSYIEDYLNSFEAALEREDGSSAEFIDLDSFADHMMMMELSRNVDAYVLSTFMHKDRGGLLTMGPVWDFNGSLGNADYFESFETQGWHYENPEFPADNPSGFRWYERLLEDPAFQERISARWTMFRQGPWSDEALVRDIDAAAALLSEVQVRNFQRWPVLGERVWPNLHAEDTYEGEVEYLKDWLLRRVEWLDEQWAR